ncbi:MAG: hypothetical protein ACREIC_19675 [Limisphaerales bacterium]
MADKLNAEDLAKGANLTVNAGPITKQARELLAAVFHKNDLYFDRWRRVELFDLPDWLKAPEVEARRSAELARLDKVIAEEETKIDDLRRPKSHHFELKPAE